MHRVTQPMSRSCSTASMRRRSALLACASSRMARPSESLWSVYSPINHLTECSELQHDISVLRIEVTADDATGALRMDLVLRRQHQCERGCDARGAYPGMLDGLVTIVRTWPAMRADVQRYGVAAIGATAAAVLASVYVVL